jgi:putative endonuclease
LYTGVTNNLGRRIAEHKRKVAPRSFTSRYNLTKLVFFEYFETPGAAISREKQIKAGSRNKKIELIESMNPGWRDLSEDF